jgi:hypothetical protein
MFLSIQSNSIIDCSYGKYYLKNYPFVKKNDGMLLMFSFFIEILEKRLEE